MYPPFRCANNFDSIYNAACQLYTSRCRRKGDCCRATEIIHDSFGKDIYIVAKCWKNFACNLWHCLKVASSYCMDVNYSKPVLQVYELKWTWRIRCHSALIPFLHQWHFTPTSLTISLFRTNTSLCQTSIQIGTRGHMILFNQILAMSLDTHTIAMHLRLTKDTDYARAP